MSCRLASLRLRDSRCLSAHEGQRVSPVMTVLELSCLGMCVGLFRALLPSWFWWFGQEFLAGPSVLALGWGPAARVLRFRQFEGELESTTYRPRVRGFYSVDGTVLYRAGLIPGSPESEYLRTSVLSPSQTANRCGSSSVRRPGFPRPSRQLPLPETHCLNKYVTHAE